MLIWKFSFLTLDRIVDKGRAGGPCALGDASEKQVELGDNPAGAIRIFALGESA